jgi:hypothetical protein
MTFVVLCLFVGLVIALAYASRKTGTSAPGCCAPADPGRDLRMRATDPDPETQER